CSIAVSSTATTEENSSTSMCAGTPAGYRASQGRSMLMYFPLLDHGPRRRNRGPHPTTRYRSIGSQAPGAGKAGSRIDHGLQVLQVLQQPRLAGPGAQPQVDAVHQVLHRGAVEQGLDVRTLVMRGHDQGQVGV